LFALGFIALAVVVLAVITFQNRGNRIKKELLSDWENNSWAEAYAKSADALQKKPLDPFLLTINGFAAYQLAISQINNADTLGYLDNCIWSLRKVLFKKDGDGRVSYVLGKAYYEKGADYADLSVRYLEQARAAGFSSGDLSEYLGLAYAGIREYRKSVESLSLSLNPADESQDSDRLLLAMARSYMGLEDWAGAKAYLNRCIEQTKDSVEALKARLLLGHVLVNSGDQAGAEAAFLEVLEKAGRDENSAGEASFELGEIYNAQGDAIKARAAWRRALNYNYQPARARFNM